MHPADPVRFRFARETSFGRRHLNFWARSPILLWIVSEKIYSLRVFCSYNSKWLALLDNNQLQPI
jgi:hypothetical protein